MSAIRPDRAPKGSRDARGGIAISGPGYPRRLERRLRESDVLADVRDVEHLETTERSQTEHVHGVTRRRRSSREPTGREVQVLQLVADGFGSAEIARRLWVSEETVKTHVTHVLDKLDATSRANAVAIGIRRGLIH